MDKALVQKLKKHFNKAKNVGGDTLVSGKNLIKRNPVQSALFALVAANVIKRTRRESTSSEQ